MLIALASGTALCGVVGWSVVRSESQAREREALAARRDAHELAVSLRAALQNVAVLATVPTDARFVVRGGRVVVDDEVGWLTVEAEAASDAFVEGGLRQAQQAEFVAHDPAAASARFDALLASLTAPRDASLPVLAAAAWQAQRHGANERTATLIHRLDAAVAEHEIGRAHV